MLIQQSTFPAARSEGAWRHGGAAVPRRDGAGRASSRRRRRDARSCGFVAIEMVHGVGRQHRLSARRRTCGRRRRSGTRFDLSPEQPGAARAVPRLPDHRQQHRRAQRRGVHRAGNRRRSLPLERGVPDAVAPEADAGLGRPRRHVARSDLRARSTGRTRRFRRCSCASRTSTRRAAAPTATRAPTPTRSAGRRRTSRCR